MCSGIFSPALQRFRRVTRFTISILVSASAHNAPFFSVAVCISSGCVNKLNIFIALLRHASGRERETGQIMGESNVARKYKCATVYIAYRKVLVISYFVMFFFFLSFSRAFSRAIKFNRFSDVHTARIARTMDIARNSSL